VNTIKEPAIHSTQWQVHSLGDHAIIFSLPALMDATIVLQINALKKFLLSKNIQGIKDYIPSYHSLVIVFDILPFLKTIQLQFETSSSLSFAQKILAAFLSSSTSTPIENAASTMIQIPVCYDPILGIDLENISMKKKLSIDKIIELHTQNIYQVYCLGFLPGFAYMGNVAASIQMPRHEKPRSLVTAGSVGIAGAQTGIYPKNSPGGWQIIGKTSWKMFDPIQLTRVQPGDQIQFYAIDYTTFLSQQEN
jgi:inhibitor of KinA